MLSYNVYVNGATPPELMVTSILPGVEIGAHSIGVAVRVTS